VNKKLIIMVAIIGLVSFAGMFAFAWLTKATPQVQNPEVAQATPASQETDLKLTEPQPPTQPQPITSDDAAVDSKMKKAMTENQLKSLVCEVREKIEEYNSKLQDFEVREQRLQLVQETLKKDIEELDNLRIELASTVARLKSEQDKLQKSRVEIAKTEKNNLMSIAATYDKMDATSAGKILTNMSHDQNGSADDAVKILYYMSERTKAKILASIAEAEPATSAYLCQKLKRIIERE